MEENMVVIKEPQTFYFDFDLPKNLDLSQNAMNLWLRTK